MAATTSSGWGMGSSFHEVSLCVDDVTSVGLLGGLLDDGGQLNEGV